MSAFEKRQDFSGDPQSLLVCTTKAVSFKEEFKTFQATMPSMKP